MPAMDWAWLRGVDGTTAWAASAAVAGSIAAIYAGLTFHRNSAADHLVKWEVDVTDRVVTLTCHGPGDAREVEVMISESAMALTRWTYKRESMPAGSRARLGSLAPTSTHEPVGTLHVEYTRRGRLFRRKIRDTWTTELV